MEPQLLKSILMNRGIEPFVHLRIETPRYVLKTLNQAAELEAVLRMRGEIFAEEYGVTGLAGALDVDRFDLGCDHLLIQYRETGEIVGSYRLLCSAFTSSFYSETEFELTDFLSSPGIKLELGRACIRKEHRKGTVISLLWRGIVQYAIETRADYLFGCSSVKTTSFASICEIQESLKLNGQLGSEWKIEPNPAFRFREDEKRAPHCGLIELPSLLRSYFSAGAKVYGEPALDRDFNCVDYLTILKLSELKSSFERRYRNEQSA
ncbi:MAG: GNAT family N-acetyltransferase [Bdellovibrionales bacterium]|nr:GNAT family N-acetyltransferase [Bdellovibrionales bacterium]